MPGKQFHQSDAWLLLAIIYASRGGNATLEKIIAAGDYIEHAIFTPAEFESGLARLSAAGYIEEKNGLFSATDTAMRAYAKNTSPRRYVHKEFQDIERFLSPAEALEQSPDAVGPHSAAEGGLKYPGFTEERFAEAVKCYLENVFKKPKAVKNNPPS